MIEKEILAIAQLFAREVSRLEARRAGTNASITLCVRQPPSYKSELPTFSLECNFYDGENWHTVRASSLGTIMDEVKRRLAFTDRELMEEDRNNTALAALEAPKEI